MSQLRALLPLPAVLSIEGGSPDPACSSVMESPDVVCASPRPSRRAICRRRPTRVMETPVRIAPRLTIQDPLATAGAVMLNCRPQVLPGAMDVSGTDLAEIRSMSRAGVATTVPPEREQSFGGGDLLSLICPELGVSLQIDTGTDLEDELSIPASPPAADEHGAVPLSMLADVDSELEQVFGDVGSLPTMVTPVCDLDGGLRVIPAECPVIEPPGVSVVVTRPSMVYSPAGPMVVSPEFSHPLTGSVGVLQLQHDAGLILSNVQVLQQLVTALNRTSSDVLWAVHGRRPFPANAMQQVMPSYRVRRVAHYMMAMGLWRPPVATEIRGPLPLAMPNACMSCSDCFPDVPM